MNRLWKKALILAAIGFLTGVLVGTFFVLQNGHAPLKYLGLQGIGASVAYFLCCGILGAVNMGSEVIYEIEQWGITRATITHFLISMTGITLLGLSLKWSGRYFLITMTICTALYVLIWLGFYTAYRREIRKINEDLKKWRSNRK